MPEVKMQGRGRDFSKGNTGVIIKGGTKMKAAVTGIVSIMVTCFLTVAAVEGGELDDFVRSLSIQAEADSTGFRADLIARFGVPGTQVDVVLRSVDNPADAYMCLRIAQVAHLSNEVVLREYRAHRHRGWGVIAMNLGIKPGSREFHELKEGRFDSHHHKHGRSKRKRHDD
jgi:hypothetical protein